MVPNRTQRSRRRLGAVIAASSAIFIAGACQSSAGQTSGSPESPSAARASNDASPESQAHTGGDASAPAREQGARATPVQASPEDQPGAEAPTDLDVTDEEVKSFAEAFSDIHELQAEYQKRLKDAEGQEELQQIEEEARQDVTEVIEEHGFTVERFDNIVRAVQDDPELQQRIRQEIREQQPAGGQQPGDGQQPESGQQPEGGQPESGQQPEGGQQPGGGQPDQPAP